MAEKFDWAEVTGRTVERLRAPKIVPVPDAIVAAAQRSWDGVTDGDKTLHVMLHEFPTAEVAKEFARLVKKAGAHTTPRTSVSAVINPDPKGEVFDEPTTDRHVSWKAGKPRGRQAS
jgi:hypothetical protein